MSATRVMTYIFPTPFDFRSKSEFRPKNFHRKIFTEKFSPCHHTSRPTSNFGIPEAAMDGKQTQCSEVTREHGLSEATRPLPLNPQIARQRKCAKSSGVSDKSAKAKQQDSHRRANAKAKLIQEIIAVQPLDHLYRPAQHGTEGTSDRFSRRFWL